VKLSTGVSGGLSASPIRYKALRLCSSPAKPKFLPDPRGKKFHLFSHNPLVAEIAVVVKKKNCFIYKNQCYIICMELKEANTIDTVVFDQVTVRV